MPQLHINTRQRIALFNHLQSREGVSPLWGLVEQLYNRLDMKALEKQTRAHSKDARKAARAVDLQLRTMALDHPERPELEDKLADLRETLEDPEFLRPDAPVKTYVIEALEAERLHALTKELRAQGEEGAALGTQCQACRRPWKTTGADWRVFRPLVREIERAYEKRDEKVTKAKGKGHGKVAEQTG